jgi:hypothetical protein
MTAEAYEAARARLQALADWWAAEGQQNRNEATTRLHLIDELLQGTLDWPKGHIIAEESHGGTYADYALGRPATRMIVEAKREGVYFELPIGVGPAVIELRTLFDGNAKFEEAVRQAVGYSKVVVYLSPR